MSNILVRTITGAIFITVMLLPLYFENKLIPTAVYGVFMLLGAIEYNKLFENSSVVSVNWKLNVFMNLLFFGLAIGMNQLTLPFVLILIFIPLLFVWALTELWRKKEHPLVNVGVSFFSIIYIVVPFFMITDLHLSDNHSLPVIAGMLILIWTNDTFAYLSGRFFGKTKLFERISPKKTWEGTIGGIVFTVLMSVALSLLFDPEYLLFWIVSAIIIAPLAILGDLFESLIKRSLNIKDSGNILPGHGGILDRFDATLFVVPFFYLWSIFYTYFC